MSHPARKIIGVIGLGIIGRGVTANLRQKGFQVFVWNRTPRRVPNFIGSPGELAETCDCLEIIETGEIGQASAIKIATNMVTAASVQAAAEALGLIQALGVPLQKFVEAMQVNASHSTTLAMKMPKMTEANFEPHFSVKHMLKDMEIANQIGSSHHLELGVTSAARDRLVEQLQLGHGDDDFSAVARKYLPEIPPVGQKDAEAASDNAQMDPDAIPPALEPILADF